MERFAKLTEQVAMRFRSLSVPNRIAAALFCLAILAGLLFFTNGTSSQRREPLFDGRTFSYQELAEMSRAFRDAGLLDSRIMANQIHVPSGEKDAYLVALQTTDALPSEFDESVDQAVASSRLFATAQENEMSYRHAEQKKLARIVASLNGIENASVQYDEVKKSGFPPTVEVRAFVAVRAVGGRELEFEQIEAIRDTVAGYVAGLERADVTVTDLVACRAYPGSYDADPAVGASQGYLSAKRMMESEFRRKIQRRLEIYPGVVVGVDVHLTHATASPTQSGATAQAASNPLVPQLVTASIGLPQSYLVQVWRDRTAASDASVPEQRTLQQIEQDVHEEVRRAVLAMLPPPQQDMQTRQQVTVTSYMDDLARNSRLSATDANAEGVLRQNKYALALGLLVVVASMLTIGWKYRLLWAGQVKSIEPTVCAPRQGDTAENAQDAASEAPHHEAKPEDEITKIVKQNPEAAAELIRKWIDNAA